MRAWWLAGLVLLPLPALAADCTASPRLEVHNYPGARNIPNINNLIQPTGKALPASGEQLMISGRILDTSCVPVADAMVELWQVDPFGKWRLATAGDLANPNPVFTGAGRTYTDNDGHFSFLTSFPAEIKNHGPHLHLKISADGMKRDFYTMLWFADDMRNDKDMVYKKLKADARDRATLKMRPMAQDVNSGFIGTAEIILPFDQPYRGY